MFRSFAARSSIVSAGAVLIVCVLAFVIASRALQAQLEAHYVSERRSDFVEWLKEHFGPDTKDFAALTALVQRRAQSSKVELMLRHRSGVVVTGSVQFEPPSEEGCAVRVRGTAQFLVCLTAVRELEGMAEPTVLIGATELRPAPGQGFWLLIGILVMAAIAVPATALVGYALSRRLERRLEAITSGARAVMEGDLARRLPVEGSNDELDRLVVVVNAMLERVDLLVHELRHVTDDIAHDLRSPLARVRKELEDALHRPREPKADEASFERSIEDLDAVLRTFEEILYIAGMTSRSAHQPGEIVDLSRLVADLGVTYQAVAEDEHGKRLFVEVAPGQRVRGEEQPLSRLIINLLENALKHGGGTVRVSLAPGEGGASELKVEDDGPGVPEAERANVVKRFYRLDHSRSTPGTGLGLAIVAAIAQLHRAELTLSDADPGLRVTVRFPSLGAGLPEARTAPAEAPPILSKVS